MNDEYIRNAKFQPNQKISIDSVQAFGNVIFF